MSIWGTTFKPNDQEHPWTPVKNCHCYNCLVQIEYQLCLNTDIIDKILLQIVYIV